MTGGVGTIVRRVVQNLGGGTNAMNFVLGVETNASGALQVYAGYVLADGSQYLVRGGELPTGTWTHVAAVYNSANATLTLYTNGSLAASSNGLVQRAADQRQGRRNVRADRRGLPGPARRSAPVGSRPHDRRQIRTNFNKTVSRTADEPRPLLPVR